VVAHGGNPGNPGVDMKLATAASRAVNRSAATGDTSSFSEGDSGDSFVNPQLTSQPLQESLSTNNRAVKPKLGLHVPVLMYHYIRVAPPGDKVGYNLSVTPSDFAAQMKYLREHGYTTITMRQLDLALLKHEPLPSKVVALTFDDGYRDFYTAAAPVLRENGFTATNYVPTQLVDRAAYMTWDQVQELDAQGFEMAGHTQFHIDVTHTAVARAKTEIAGCKADLEAHLGHPVVDFAYPYGKYDLRSMQWLRDAGFWSATTTQNGAFHTTDDMFDMTRVRIGGGVGLDYFARAVQ
jgi:peptidoglycan/xylan/chitin deacetylase (PgdA/CDA1 family)